MAKVCVDKNLCIGCGACASIEPNVFEITDEGHATATKNEINDDVKMAADSCPTGAIKIEENEEQSN